MTSELLTIKILFPGFPSYIYFSSETILSLRSLNCGRTKMHKNLFAALALNNVCWIVWYTTVPYQPQVLNENPVRGLPYMTSTSFMDFLTPSPLPLCPEKLYCLSANVG